MALKRTLLNNFNVHDSLFNRERPDICLDSCWYIAFPITKFPEISIKCYVERFQILPNTTLASRVSVNFYSIK